LRRREDVHGQLGVRLGRNVRDRGNRKPNGECPLGYACMNVTTADCPVCDVVIVACVAAPPRPLR
jgi:hypothetical protein